MALIPFQALYSHRLLWASAIKQSFQHCWQNCFSYCFRWVLDEKAMWMLLSSSFPSQ
jgi:hypothetical protein